MSSNNKKITKDVKEAQWSMKIENNKEKTLSAGISFFPTHGREFGNMYFGSFVKHCFHLICFACTNQNLLMWDKILVNIIITDRSHYHFEIISKLD